MIETTRDVYYLILVGLLVLGIAILLFIYSKVKKRLNRMNKYQGEQLENFNKRIAFKVEEQTEELKTEIKQLGEHLERYQYALEASNDGIFDLDITTDQIKLSPSIYTMLGYEPYEFPETRQDLYKIIYDEEQTGQHQSYHEQLFKNKTESTFEDVYKIKSKQGQTMWVQVKAKVVTRDKDGFPTRIVGIHSDITHEKLKDKRRSQKVLEAVIKTEDSERSRISREIHDGLQQTLTVASLNFQSLGKHINQLDETAQEKYNMGWQYLQESIVESRSVAHRLMPKAIVDFGVVSAFESLLGEMNKSAEHIDFQFHHHLEDGKCSNKQIEVTLYRILQECLNNIIKYAKATAVNVQLTENDTLYTLLIEDNGKGFDTAILEKKNVGMGFKSMQNRLDAVDGILDISSFPGKGTTILVEINKEI